MRILTVRQPWAWAIIHGGKDVENRVRNIAGGYRGPVAIHVAGAYAESVRGDAVFDAMDAWHDHPDADCNAHPWKANVGKIIGVVDLVSVHHPDVGWGCPASPGDLLPMCSAWSEPHAFHLVLANPRLLPEPIPYRGALGLRTLDDETVARIEAAIA